LPSVTDTPGGRLQAEALVVGAPNSVTATCPLHAVASGRREARLTKHETSIRGCTVLPRTVGLAVTPAWGDTAGSTFAGLSAFGLICEDPAVNPGDSGGVLVDMAPFATADEDSPVGSLPMEASTKGPTKSASPMARRFLGLRRPPAARSAWRGGILMQSPTTDAVAPPTIPRGLGRLTSRITAANASQTRTMVVASLPLFRLARAKTSLA
jgi:hypothetical protein